MGLSVEWFFEIKVLRFVQDCQIFMFRNIDEEMQSSKH